MFKPESEDNKLQCPYDATHTVIRKNFQKHLLKCKKNYPHVEVLTCPFNSIHMITEAEYKGHLASCKDRKLLVNYEGPVDDPGDVRHAPIEDEENWDDKDFNAPDFKPALFSAMQVKREK